MGCLVGRAWAHAGASGRAHTSELLDGQAYASEGLRGRVGVICAIAEDNYLFVEPTEVVWLTPDNDFTHDFEVYSNTDWTVN